MSLVSEIESLNTSVQKFLPPNTPITGQLSTKQKVTWNNQCIDQTVWLKTAAKDKETFRSSLEELQSNIAKLQTSILAGPQDSTATTLENAKKAIDTACLTFEAVKNDGRLSIWRRGNGFEEFLRLLFVRPFLTMFGKLYVALDTEFDPIDVKKKVDDKIVELQKKIGPQIAQPPSSQQEQPTITATPPPQVSGTVVAVASGTLPAPAGVILQGTPKTLPQEAPKIEQTSASQREAIDKQNQQLTTELGKYVSSLPLENNQWTVENTNGQFSIKTFVAGWFGRAGTSSQNSVVVQDGKVKCPDYKGLENSSFGSVPELFVAMRLTPINHVENASFAKTRFVSDTGSTIAEDKKWLNKSEVGRSIWFDKGVGRLNRPVGDILKTIDFQCFIGGKAYWGAYKNGQLELEYPNESTSMHAATFPDLEAQLKSKIPNSLSEAEIKQISEKRQKNWENFETKLQTFKRGDVVQYANDDMDDFSSLQIVQPGKVIIQLCEDKDKNFWVACKKGNDLLRLYLNVKNDEVTLEQRNEENQVVSFGKVTSENLLQTMASKLSTTPENLQSIKDAATSSQAVNNTQKALLSLVAKQQNILENAKEAGVNTYYLADAPKEGKAVLKVVLEPGALQDVNIDLIKNPGKFSVGDKVYTSIEGILKGIKDVAYILHQNLQTIVDDKKKFVTFDNVTGQSWKSLDDGKKPLEDSLKAFPGGMVCPKGVYFFHSSPQGICLATASPNGEITSLPLKLKYNVEGKKWQVSSDGSNYCDSLQALVLNKGLELQKLQFRVNDGKELQKLLNEYQKVDLEKGKDKAKQSFLQLKSVEKAPKETFFITTNNAFVTVKNDGTVTEDSLKVVYKNDEWKISAGTNDFTQLEFAQYLTKNGPRLEELEQEAQRVEQQAKKLSEQKEQLVESAKKFLEKEGPTSGVTYLCQGDLKTLEGQAKERAQKEEGKEVYGLWKSGETYKLFSAKKENEKVAIYERDIRLELGKPEKPDQLSIFKFTDKAGKERHWTLQQLKDWMNKGVCLNSPTVGPQTVVSQPKPQEVVQEKQPAVQTPLKQPSVPTQPSAPTQVAAPTVSKSAPLVFTPATWMDDENFVKTALDNKAVKNRISLASKGSQKFLLDINESKSINNEDLIRFADIAILYNTEGNKLVSRKNEDYKPNNSKSIETLAKLPFEKKLRLAELMVGERLSSSKSGRPSALQKCIIPALVQGATKEELQAAVEYLEKQYQGKEYLQTLLDGINEKIKSIVG
jgi:hypothetical protein